MKSSRSMGLLLGGTIALSVVSTGWSADDPSLHPDGGSKGKVSPKPEASAPYWPEAVKATAGAPNVVLILLDDVAFGDTSLMGDRLRPPSSRSSQPRDCSTTVSMCAP